MTDVITSATRGFDQSYAAEQLRRSRHPLRSLIKGFYLRNMLQRVKGPTIDFGCGAGQLLRLLPEGSEGLELNPHLVTALRNSGLAVRQARGELSDFELPGFATGHFRSLVIAHVLEHLPDPVAALQLLLRNSARLGIERVLVVVPGARGYASDRTHKTFIDRAYLEASIEPVVEGFARSEPAYFPGPWEWVGKHFVFHEMLVCFDRVGAKR